MGGTEGQALVYCRVRRTRRARREVDAERGWSMDVVLEWRLLEDGTCLSRYLNRHICSLVMRLIIDRRGATVAFRWRRIEQFLSICL